MGNKGTGTLTIDNGRTVHCRFLYIAAAANQTPDSDGTVTVDNGASLVVEPDDCPGAQICVGCDANGNAGGTAVLNIKGAGTVEVENGMGIVVPGVTVGPSGTLTGNSVLTLTGSTSSAQTASVLGTLAPSGTLTIQGNLDLTNGGSSTSANTICHVTPTANDRVDVSNATGAGQATLGGRITVIMAGTLTPGRFTLVHADAGLFGSRFQFASLISLSSGGNSCIHKSITYDTNNAYLDIVDVCATEDPEP